VEVFIFFTTIIASFFVTILVIYGMCQFGIIDIPRSLARKIHKKKIPLGGGVAPFLIFSLAIYFLYSFKYIGIEISGKSLIGIILGASIVIIGGIIDDKKNVKPMVQIIFPTLAAMTVIAFGIGPHQITNPLGGVVPLDEMNFSFGKFGTFVVFADIVVFLWLMGVMYTTKLLDGLDGLVSGITVIGALMIFFLTRQPLWYQPEVGLVAIALAGALLGFLIWNWNPAKIFLGEGGSLFCGFIIGVLAIISGSKIATTLLVLAIPVLDLLRVFAMRIKNKKPFYVGDNEHLHFKLLSKGFSHKQTVLLFYLFSLLFGLLGVFVQNKFKIMTLILLFLLMIIGGIFFTKKDTNLNRYE